MTAQWNSNVGGAHSAAGDLSNQQWSDEGARIVAGVWSAFTTNAASSDPSTGAPVAWGSREVGALWLDTGVDGTAANPVLKRWQQLTATPTYGWRPLRLRKTIFVGDPSAGVITFSPASPQAADVVFTDLSLATVLDSLQDAGSLASLVAEVTIQVEVTAGASEVITDPTKGYIAFRAKGAANQEERVYAQVAGRPNQQQVDVQLDSSEKCQFKIVVGTGTPSFAYSGKIVALTEFV